MDNEEPIINKLFRKHSEMGLGDFVEFDTFGPDYLLITFLGGTKQLLNSIFIFFYFDKSEHCRKREKKCIHKKNTRFQNISFFHLLYKTIYLHFLAELKTHPQVLISGTRKGETKSAFNGKFFMAKSLKLMNKK